MKTIKPTTWWTSLPKAERMRLLNKYNEKHRKSWQPETKKLKPQKLQPQPKLTTGTCWFEDDYDD